VYRPHSFTVQDVAHLHRLIDAHPFATLVVPHAAGLEINHLPMIFDSARARLRMHVARASPAWRLALEPGRLVTAIFHGPDAYVSPNAYEQPERSVPTWNYAVVHAHGRIEGPTPREALPALLRDLAARFEPPGGTAWTPEGTEPGTVEDLLPGIVGLELVVERLEGKFKLSQNRSDGDREGVRRTLALSPFERERQVSEWMTTLRGERG
jgi:transcriptional regulator